MDPGPGHRDHLQDHGQNPFQGKVQAGSLHRKGREVGPGHIQDRNDVTDGPDLIQPEEADILNPGPGLGKIDQGLMEGRGGDLDQKVGLVRLIPDGLDLGDRTDTLRQVLGQNQDLFQVIGILRVRARRTVQL